jgi:hypothetical protein
MKRTSPQFIRKEQQKQALADKLAAMEPEERPSGKPFYDDFDSYVKDYPEGESYRAWLTRGSPRLAIVQMSVVRPRNVLPGNYLSLCLTEQPENWRDKTCTRKIVQLLLRDNDDGFAVRRWPEEQRAEAERVFEEMKALAPFTMGEAVEVFGLRFE